MWESCSLGKYFWTPQKKLSAIFSHRDHDNHCAFERLSLSLSFAQIKNTNRFMCAESVCDRERRYGTETTAMFLYSGNAFRINYKLHSISECKCRGGSQMASCTQKKGNKIRDNKT